jgi:outer membrane protein OmpA-like peptidoglycan-associated protein
MYVDIAKNVVLCHSMVPHGYRIFGINNKLGTAFPDRMEDSPHFPAMSQFSDHERLQKGNIRMKKTVIVLVSLLVLCHVAGVPAQQSDKAGCIDHPLFPTRMPNYVIENCKTEDFGAYEFQSTKGLKNRVEGKFTFITYALTGKRETEPNGIAVVRNYENAIQKAGGTIVQSDPERWVNGTVAKDGQETWFEVHKGNGKIWLRVVEKKTMAQTIVADATVLSNNITATGHTAIYGIYFDTGKSTIKPESVQAIGEIAKLLKADPGLKIFLVGHTDNQGGIESNTKLSQDRGEAVLQALVRDHGIAAGRLRSFGCGMFSPVASNDTEEGRTKNRRVELVKQ